MHRARKPGIVLASVDVLVQTRLPPELASWLEKEAATEGESHASWLRRLIFRTAGRSHVDAWLRPAGSSVGKVHEEPVTLDLETVERLSAVEIVFAAHHPGGAPVTEHWFRDSELFREPAETCLILRGHPRPCVLTASIWNATSRRLELTVSLR